MSLLHQELTEKIIKAYYKVYNKMGYGFLEKVYENSFLIELRKVGLQAVRQHPIKVYYDDEIVGEYYADIMVENKVILELKAAKNIIEAHKIQLINYLKATEIEVGLLFNFGQEPQFSRKIFENKYK